MTIRTIFGLALLWLCAPALADFTTVAPAYEVALSDVRVPATPSSGIIFRKCRSCDMAAYRVTPRTQYIVNGKAVTLKEFRKNVFQVRERAGKVVIIKHHLESDTIESVRVSL